MDGNQISQAIALQWEEIEKALGAALDEFEEGLLPLLRKLEEDPADAGEAQKVFDLFAAYPAARQAVQRGIDLVGAHLTKTPGTGLLEQRYRYTEVPVYFGTSRQRTRSKEPAEVFGTGRGYADFGIAKVSIPDDHRLGTLEKPNWLKLKFGSNPERDVIVLSVEPMDRDKFVGEARAGLTRAKAKEVLVFLHGFNVSFEDAARRAAQIAYDLQFKGLPALYSWPSDGKIPGYDVDEGNAEWVHQNGYFSEFLKLVREQLGADVVHVVAHSMGNRILANLLAGSAEPTTPGVARLRQIVFAAPDIDADTFKEMAKKFPGKAERLTLYASSEDKALMASQKVHKYARAGQSGLDLVIAEGVDTIDASSVETDFLNHSYFGDSGTVISDLFHLVRNGLAPDDRELREETRYGNRYWRIVPRRN